MAAVQSPIRQMLQLLVVLLLAASVTSCESGKDARLLVTQPPSRTAASGSARSPVASLGPPTRSVATSQCSAPDAVLWSDARRSIGEEVTVVGPVVGTSYVITSDGQPTFLDLGVRYPDEGRVTVLIWGSERSRFPEPPESAYYLKTICVTGLVTLYKGVPQIVVDRPSQIEVV